MKSTLSEAALLHGYELFDGRDAEHPLAKQIGGATAVVRVRLIPSRHLTEPNVGYLDLAEQGDEAKILELCCEVQSSGTWSRVDAAFVDALDDASHAMLLECADQLNFKRAVSQAERQIASRTALVPLKKRLAEQMMAPTRLALESWTSSLTSQISAALAAKKP